MEEKTIIVRNKATTEVLDEIYKTLRKAIKKLPKEEADKYFYSDREIKELRKEKMK